MIHLGIDPGLTGAVAVIEADGEVSFFDTPIYKDGTKTRIDEARCADLIRGQARATSLVTIEKVNAMPKQGVTSMFSFGYGFGVWMGIIAALQIPHQLVTPQAWKKVMFAGYTSDTDSRVVARRLWPLYTEETLSRKKDHGRADASLIAEFGRRLNNPNAERT